MLLVIGFAGASSLPCGGVNVELTQNRGCFAGACLSSVAGVVPYKLAFPPCWWTRFLLDFVMSDGGAAEGEKSRSAWEMKGLCSCILHGAQTQPHGGRVRQKSLVHAQDWDAKTVR